MKNKTKLKKTTKAQKTQAFLEGKNKIDKFRQEIL